MAYKIRLRFFQNLLQRIHSNAMGSIKLISFRGENLEYYPSYVRMEYEQELSYEIHNSEWFMDQDFIITLLNSYLNKTTNMLLKILWTSQYNNSDSKNNSDFTENTINSDLHKITQTLTKISYNKIMQILHRIEWIKNLNKMT